MMAIWKEMMEFQGNLLKAIMVCPPLTMYLPLNPHCQRHKDNILRFISVISVSVPDVSANQSVLCALR